MLPTKDQILKAVSFKTSRSGGKGGQHVNKVSSKVELIFDLEKVDLLSNEEKGLIKSRLENRLDSEGLLHIVAQEERSQLLNKEKAIAKLATLLRKTLEIQKTRKPTKIPKSVIQNRLKNKSALAEKKEFRKKPSL